LIKLLEKSEARRGHISKEVNLVGKIMERQIMGECKVFFRGCNPNRISTTKILSIRSKKG
jgi:hypothetical protein